MFSVALAFLVYRDRERAKEVFLSFVSVEAILVAEVRVAVRPLNASRRREGRYTIQKERSKDWVQDLYAPHLVAQIRRLRMRCRCSRIEADHDPPSSLAC